MYEPLSKSPGPVTPEAVVATPVHHKPWVQQHRKALIIAGVTVLLAAGAGILGWNMAKAPTPVATTTPSATPTPTPSPTPTPVTKASPLTGVMVAPELANRPISAIVVENHPDARPQSGLSDAGVVYEANAEGGITRFLAFFLDNRPAAVGPVRSLRPYFVDWGLEFNSPVAHAGGSADAIDLIAPTGMKDISALGAASSGFYRTRDRVAPHNLYTNADKMDALLVRYGFQHPADFVTSPRKPDTPNPAPAHPNIHIEYSYAGYAVDYKYDPATNDYARFLAGVPHIDRNSGKQIRVKNIVVEMMPTSYGTTRIGEQAVKMATVGSGTGWVITGGNVTPITWSKPTRNTRTKLTDAAGAEVPLQPGNTWYSIVPVGKTVTF